MIACEAPAGLMSAHGHWANAQIVKGELNDHGAAWVPTPGLPFSAVSPWTNDYMAFCCLSFLTCKIRVAVLFNLITVPSDQQK